MRVNAINIGFKKRKRRKDSFSWSSYWRSQDNFYELWVVTGSGSLVGLIKSDILTVGGTVGSYTFQVPDEVAYSGRDTDLIFFDSGGTQRVTTEAELVGYDFAKTIVFYSDTSPYSIIGFGILDTGQSVTDKMRDDFHLSVWWDNTLSAYGVVKGNRGTGQSVWSGLLPYEEVLQDGNTKGWYVFDDMDTITKDESDLVSLWEDKLGSGNDLGIGTTAPIWTLNGVLFDGISDSLVKGFEWDQPAFVYMVMKQVTWTRYRRIFGSYSTNISYLWQDATTPGLKAFAGTASAQNDNLTVDTWGIVRVLLNGASSSLQINATAATTGNFGTAAMNGFTLGARGGESNPSNIQVKEIILRKIADTSTDEGVLYDYLKDKYSL